MKIPPWVISMLVIIALLFYIITTIMLFVHALEVAGILKPTSSFGEFNKNVSYLNSGLTGLVGSIVATAFGVKNAQNSNEPKTHINTLSAKKQKLNRLASFIKPVPKVSIAQDYNTSESKPNLALFYVLSYIFLGLAGVIIWVAVGDTKAIPELKFMATAFIGLLVPIVANYFSANSN